MIQDQAQRDRALDISESFIVQAPAGSGKTELISQRFLALLARADVPESILAITFTRKAASEMRLRILQALESASADKPNESHKLKTWQLAKAVMQQDQRQGWQLLSSPSRLRVVTIDSLNASLTRQMPLLSKMGATVSPVEQADRLYLEAARQTLRLVEAPEYQHELSLLMLHLGNNVERIQQLLVTMLSRRDQWLRHIASINSIEGPRKTLENALQTYISEHLEKLHRHFPAGMVEALADIARFVSQHVDPVKQPNIALWAKDDIQLSTQPSSLPYWLAFSELLFTGAGDPRKSLSIVTGFPPPSKEKDKTRKAQLELQKSRMKDLISEVSQHQTLSKLLTDLRFMPAPGYTEDQWQLVKALSKVLVLSAAQLQLVFADNGQVDFTQIALSARQALGNQQNPTDLAMVLDYRLQHILIDEFQDTSQGQMELIESLTREWQPGDGKTLFLVGDPMQSIYRFREAEVGLYLKARETGIGNIRLEPLTLSVNFRSQHGIVSWVNENLAEAFPVEEDRSTGAVTYSPSVPFHPAGVEQAVNIHLMPQRDDVNEAEKIANIVNDKLRNTDETIAILVRSRAQLVDIVRQLNQQQIPFQAVELESLANQPCIIDLYILSRALHHLGDRLHWLALLRAPWCGLLINDLQILAEAPDPVILNNCQNTTVVAKLSSNGQARLARFMNQLEPFIKRQGNLSLRHLLQLTWSAIGGYQLYPGSNNINAVNRYLELVSQQEKGGRLDDLTVFNEALEQLYAPADSQSDGRLQIMTIHKSKGLEFDNVILPGLGKTSKSDESTLLEWLERPNAEGRADLLMAPIKASKDDQADQIGLSLKAINKAKAGHEMTRLLYVALTRAKKQLHLLGHINFDQKGQKRIAGGSLLAIIWPNIAENFNHLRQPANDEEQPETLTTFLPDRKSMPLNWQPVKPEPLPILTTHSEPEENANPATLDFDWASETARHIGTLSHRYYEQIALNNHFFDPKKPELHRPGIEKSLSSLGTPSADIRQAADKVLLGMVNLCSDSRGRWIIKSQSEAENEFALTYKSAQTFKKIIIDRTFVDDNGNRWIIDYKTGSHEGTDIESFLDNEMIRYRRQLEHYANLFSHLDDRPIKLGLYFPLLKGWREWSFTPQ
ncbi:MAG: UvrD-helicase domain-containing protein [Gammaproteobacteria bacterium]